MRSRPHAVSVQCPVGRPTAARELWAAHSQRGETSAAGIKTPVLQTTTAAMGAVAGITRLLAAVSGHQVVRRIRVRQARWLPEQRSPPVTMLV